MQVAVFSDHLGINSLLSKELISMHFLENKEKIITFTSIRLEIEELIKVYFFNFVSEKAKI